MAVRNASSIARSRIIAVVWLALTAVLGAPALLPTLPSVHAAEAAQNLLQPGDIAASGFAGVKLQVEGLPPGVDPATKTVIDPDGVTLRIYDGSPVAGPLAGQQLDLPLRKELRAKDIGHVFGLVFDNLPTDERGTPGLYAGATSSFGLYIVGPDKDGDGQPDRLTKGAPDAKFMEGLFGPALLGGSGAIWKIDSVTGEVSLYAELPQSGPGIGGLAFDPASRSLYVSDLDTGIIHQLKGLFAGAGGSEFDHGLQARPLAGKDAVADDGQKLDITSPSFDTANPTTWGFTQDARRIDGMAVHNKRLYYGVKEGLMVWSVGLADDGSFLQDARIEAAVTTSGPSTITAIAFDNSGDMVLALRNAVQSSGDYAALVAGGPTDVIRYAPESPDDPQTASLWQLDRLTYPVGQSRERRDGSGGIALQYAYKPDGSLDLAACGGTLVASGDVLDRQRAVHGLQIGDAGRFQAAAGANIPTAFVALDPTQDDMAARGHAGGVAVLSQCEGGGGFPPMASGGTQFPGVAGGGGGSGQTGFPGVENGGGGQPGFPGVENGGGGQAGFPGVENGGGGQANFPPGEGGGGQTQNLTVVKVGAVPKCSPERGCAFNIEILNNGPEVPGPITINEQIEAPQAALTGEPNAPWQCSKAAPFTCTHPGPVPANGKLDMRVVFAPHTPPEAKELKNCVAIAGGAAQPPVNQQKAQLVAPAALPPPTKSNANGLAVEVVGVPASCSPTAGTCEFEVKVTNNSGNPVTGPLRVSQTLSIGTQTQAKNTPKTQSLPEGLQCKPDGRELDCQQPELTLAQGESRSMRVAFAVDTTEGGAANFVQSKATVTFGPLAGEATAAIAFDEPLNNKLPEPGAQQEGQNQPGAAQAGQAQAQAQPCATIPLDPNAPVQTGPVIITKTGPAACPKVGPCTFEITLANTTDAAVPGPIPFTDTLDIPGAQLSEEPIPAPFACDKGGPPFNCTFGNQGQGLGPHESKSVSLTFNLNLPEGTTSLKNCAVKPAAPKKAELVLPRKKAELTGPMSLRSSMTEASFHPELISDRNSLLHFIDNPGGNIAGMSGGECGQWAWKYNNGLRMLQSNGLYIFIEGLVIDANGAISNGGALYYTVPGNKPIHGTVTGSMSGSNFTFDVKWTETGDTGHYVGTIRPDGSFTGDHTNAAGAADTFVNDGNWLACKASRLCVDYAAAAIKSSEQLTNEGCSPTEPIARWSRDKQAHVDFCTAHLDQVDAENKARADEVASCAARKQARDACAAAMKDVVALNDQMKAINCKDAIPNLTIESATNVCLLKPGTELAAKPQMQQKLDACKAQLANNGNAGAGAGGADAGGAGAGGQAPADAAGQQREPAPEQCAVVQIKDVAPPGGGQANPAPKPEQPQASIAGPLSLMKTLVPNSCVENRCAFTITVGNESGADLLQNLEFADEVTGDGKSFDSTTVTAEAGGPRITCSRQGQNFVCARSGPLGLGPNGTSSTKLTVDLGKGIGVVKEMKNCATLKGAATSSCATAPLQAAPAPAPAPAQAKNLALANNPAVAQCSDIGGGCAFVASLNNPADAPEFNGPVSFTAHLSQPDGSAFPNITMEDGGQALPLDGVTPPISCKKDGNDVTCTATALKVPPGKSVQIPMTFKPGAGTMATAIKSCASLKGGEQSCTSIPLVKGPLLRASKFTAANTCAPSCAFAISLKNVGTIAAPGPFVIKEDFSPVNADTSIETIDGDFACFPAAGGTFGCISNKTPALEPGQSLNGRVQFKTSTISPTYTNCIDYNPAANGNPSPFDKEFAGRCVTIKEANLFRPQMSLFAAVTDLGCTVNGPCRYDIIVSNFGTQYTGPIEFIDEVPENGVGGKPQSPPAGLAMGGDPDWDCQKLDARRLKCTFKKQTIGFGGANVTVPILVTPGPGWKKNDTVQNCATLNVTDGTIGDGLRACAEYTLDPFNVKVTKTGDQSCTIGGDCNFTIRLFNPGPIDHNAPVTISDKLSGISSAQIVSISPPLPCATQPTQVPFSCTSPGPVRLDLDAPEGSEFGPRTFKMVVRLPRYYSPSKQFSNCADVSDGVTQASDQSCQSVSLVPAEPQVSIAKSALSASCSEGTPCEFVVTLTNTGDEPVQGPVAFYDTMLTGNQQLSQVKLDGAPPAPWTCIGSAAPGMQCSNPGPLPPKTGVSMRFAMVPLPGSLGAATEVTNCADYTGGQGLRACVNVPVKPAAAPPTGQCTGGRVLTNGTCACPAGATWNGMDCGTGGFNTSKPITPEPAPIVTAPATTCKFGMVLASSGLCACPPNTNWTGKACEPSLGTGGISKSMQTAPGTGSGGTNLSKQPSPEVLKGCPADRPVGTYPNCCPRGYYYGQGMCRYPNATPAQEVLCKSGLVKDARTGKCVACKRGTHAEGNACVPDKIKKPTVCPADRPVGTYPNCCPQGTEYRGGKCRFTKPAQIRCRRSQVFDPLTGACVSREPSEEQSCPATRPIGIYPNCCPEGYRFARGVCRPLRQQQPEQQRSCPADRPNGTYPNCCPDGYEFNGRRCGKIGGRQQPNQPQQQQQHDCPPGYRVLSQPNKYGAYCEIIPVPGPAPTPAPAPRQCTGGKVSTPQGCVCPAGMRENSDGVCVDKVG